MKFTLKDYQLDAVRDALANLKDARDDWLRKSRICSRISLSASTLPLRHGQLARLTPGRGNGGR